MLALDWAAVHDIIKGEPDLSLEYATVAFSIVVFAVMILVWLKQRAKKAANA